MEERVWYVLLYLISNSQILLPSHSLSLRDGSPALQAHVVGSHRNGSTVHITLQRSHGCPKGQYRSYASESGGSRAQRSTYSTIVGRSGQRPRAGTNKVPPDVDGTVPIVGNCVPCSVCQPHTRVSKECTSEQDTKCQSCDEAEGDAGVDCEINHDEHLVPSVPSGRGSGIQESILGNLEPSNVKERKEEDVNINIQEAGRDERNSWYFLSLCALIGLLVFLSLVMGAYLVSVKVTSWWRYQRPVSVTVRRRGHSIHEDANNQIEFSMSSFPNRRYDDIINQRGSRGEAAPRMGNAAAAPGGYPRPPPSSPLTEGFPSTSSGTSSKIHVVRLKGGGLDADSTGSFDSYVLDVVAKEQLSNQYYIRDDGNGEDSSDYSSDDEAESGMGFLPLRASPVLQGNFTGTGKHLYQSVPLHNKVPIDGQVHIVQWPSMITSDHHSYFKVNGVGHCNILSAAGPNLNAEPPLEHYLGPSATGDDDTCCAYSSVMADRDSDGRLGHQSTAQGENIAGVSENSMLRPTGRSGVESNYCADAQDCETCVRRCAGDPSVDLPSGALNGMLWQRYDHHHKSSASLKKVNDNHPVDATDHHPDDHKFDAMPAIHCNVNSHSKSDGQLACDGQTSDRPVHAKSSAALRHLATGRSDISVNSSGRVSKSKLMGGTEGNEEIEDGRVILEETV